MMDWDKMSDEEFNTTALKICDGKIWRSKHMRYGDIAECLKRADRLRPGVLDRCASVHPAAVFLYAVEKVSRERLAQCAKKMPGVALWLAGDKLPAELLDKCASADSYSAIQYAVDLLSDERLDQCARENPLLALERVAGRLTDARLEWCFRECKGQIDPLRLEILLTKKE